MKTVILCEKKMNFDGSMDFSTLTEEVSVYPDADPDKFLERIQGADILVTKENPVTGEMISAMPSSLKLIVEAGTGYNNIDIKAAAEEGITVCNVPAYSTDRVAETAVMLMLCLASSMQKQLRMLERGDRSNFTEHLKVPHFELLGKTLGIIGYGRIGRKTAEICRTMGMKVITYSRTQRYGDVEYVSLKDLLWQSDFISLHCPLTDATRHIIGSGALQVMKPSAFLINTSRGALIDEEALIEALRSGTIAGAALDVQEAEPPEESNPLYDMENVIITPHMGWKGYETRQRLLSIIREDIDGFRNGNIINKVN